MERVLVTGIPRSGTTLVTAMINDLDRSLCLSEPSRHVEWLETSSSRREYADRVIGDFDSVLAEIKRNGKILFLSENATPETRQKFARFF